VEWLFMGVQDAPPASAERVAGAEGDEPSPEQEARTNTRQEAAKSRAKFWWFMHHPVG
jgi:hypothetical protein